MFLKKILTSALLLSLAFTGVQAAGHAKHHAKSNGKKYANAVKLKESVKKYYTFEATEYIHPADALYSSVWDNYYLNPYKTQMPDSFKINVSDYNPPVLSHVSSGYGPRWGRFHCGVDIPLHVGDSVRSAFDGEVRIAHKFNKGGYGWYIVIRHDNGLETLYGHLKKPLVKDEQRVKAGEVIALGGNTGHSTGPHLHFETRFLGIPMDPKNIIDFDEHVILKDNYTIKKFASFEEWNKFTDPNKYYSMKRKAKKQKRLAMMKAKAAEKDSIAKLSKQIATVGLNNPETVTPLQEENTESNTKTKAPLKQAKAMTHVVKQGDSLFRIARKNGTTVQKLCKLNNLDENKPLKLGSKLKLR